MKCFVAVLFALAVATTYSIADDRVPAEWEQQESIWMQWPKGWETSYRTNFAGIIDAVVQHEGLNLIVNSSYAKTQAQNFLSNAGVPLDNITFHIMPYNWAWMRDNGPVYVVDGENLILQDWGFDCWGGIDYPCDSDDAVPEIVASLIGAVYQDHNDIIVERGALEFNGEGALITTWPCMQDRNPWMSKEDYEQLFLEVWNITQVVWLEEVPPSDIFTGGHVDGIARFLDADTVIVNQCANTKSPDAFAYEDAAQRIENAGFEVVRLTYPGDILYQGTPMGANYINWLIINGAIVAGSFDHATWDAQARLAIESFYPDHEVHMVDIRDVWLWGGGVHCVTNDRPLVVDVILGDVNGDGVVNTNDLLAVIGAWGACTGCPEDFNDDGQVNVSDILILIGNWS